MEIASARSLGLKGLEDCATTSAPTSILACSSTVFRNAALKEPIATSAATPTATAPANSVSRARLLPLSRHAIRHVQPSPSAAKSPRAACCSILMGAAHSGFHGRARRSRPPSAGS